VVLIHCETGTGVENPLAEVAAVCEQHGKGLIVDAMSSFGALPIDARTVRFDALVAASGKCLEGVPGMGFVFLRKAMLDGCAGNSQSLAMDLHDQHQYMEKTGQWRFTPPTHVVVALAEAITPVPGGRRAARAAGALHRQLPHAGRRHGGAGLQALPAARSAGADHRHLPRAGAPGLRLQALLPGAKARGFILYPGKLTQVETFRVGCIGAIGANEMQQAVNAVGRARDLRNPTRD
jgi:2-aminoethylphosphonate-pyruvate transaminase